MTTEEKRDYSSVPEAIGCSNAGDPIIQVRNIRKWYQVNKGLPIIGSHDWLKAVDDVSFDVPAGETIGLVGESGCGKTTTAKMVLGLEDPSTDGGVPVGSIYFEGQDVKTLTAAGRREMRRSVQAVFQDPWSSLNPRMRVNTIIGEPLEINTTMTKKERDTRSGDLLAEVGLNPYQGNLYPHEFSGGQRQRIVIARALALDPKILVLDEPTSALDVSVQAQILNLLNDLQEKYNLTYIFISHDLSVIEYMCDRLAVMYLGKVVEEANTEELFSNPQHPYTKALLSATPNFNKDKEKIMILGDVPSPMTYLDESKAKLATEITEQERLEIKSIEGKGLDYIVRSSLNEILPLKKVANEHYARVK